MRAFICLNDFCGVVVVVVVVVVSSRRLRGLLLDSLVPSAPNLTAECMNGFLGEALSLRCCEFNWVFKCAIGVVTYATQQRMWQPTVE